MRGLLAQAGMGFDCGALFVFLFALMYAGVAVVLWLVLLAASGGRGPRLPAVRRLPRFVGRLLGAVAAALWAACAWGYADGGERSEVFRAVLPYAVAVTVCAVSVAHRSRAAAAGR